MPEHLALPHIPSSRPLSDGRRPDPSARLTRLLVSWIAVGLLCLAAIPAGGQSFGLSNLDFAGNGGVAQSTSLEFGPDGRLYVLQLDGTIDVLTIVRNGPDDYVVTASEEILLVKEIPNHNDDGSPSAIAKREATGLTVVGTASNPIIYATSSDSRVGGPSGDKDLDTNSGVITRLTWNGSSWDAVDIVRGLPRSEENHATNGLEFVSVGGTDYLIVCSGGHTNAGSPSTNFAWLSEYALSAAVLSVDLAAIEALPIQNDGVRDYIYNLPTVDDPTRPNGNGISDPNQGGYDGVDENDPWGGNDGLNQAKLVPGGPVQIFSPGYRNTYDLVVTESGAVYVTENGANGGWGGFPENEGTTGSTTNNYRPGEPGSTGADPVDGEAKVNNHDHLHLLTNDIDTYAWGSFYGGHPAPIRANPLGAGLFTRGIHSSDPGDSNGNGYEDDWFRTQPYDPNGSGEAADPSTALPADWPPVPVALANPVEGDFRNPGGSNPDGPVDDIVTTWANNTNGIDEYTASNFGGAMQGDLIAGRSQGTLHRVQLNPDGSLDTLIEDWNSNLGGNPLGVTANGDLDPFPGTIWVGTFSSNIVVLEPQDLTSCILPGEPGYDPDADNDSDGYTNQDEDDNGTDLCNGGSQPNDFDKAAGAPLVSNLNDPDDDADGIDDSDDVMQLGDPTLGGTDAFSLPVDNELFSDNPELQGYLGLGFTGMMNNGDPNPNWLDWIDYPGDGPNPNDVLGGAVGAMTMQMTHGTAFWILNDQEKAFQYGVDVPATGAFTIQGRLLNLGSGFQLYPTGGDAQLGIFMGDGTQSNYIEIFANGAGVAVFQELDDMPQGALVGPIAPEDRPLGSIEFELRVDADSGLVEALYGLDGGPLASLGTIAAGGSILQAIQTPGTPVVVGLIGSSYSAGVEVEGTWDYLKVLSAEPSVTSPIPDATLPPGAGPLDVDLDAHFGDDQGVGNLTYTIEDVSNPVFGASIVGSTLTITFPGSPGTGTITVRATDADGRFVEQTFDVTASASSPPTATAAIPDLTVSPGATPVGVGLDAYFDDDQGVGNLTYSVEDISNPAFGATVGGSTLTVSFPATSESGTITVRATDPDTQFVEQTFAVTTATAVALYRVNAGGIALPAIDGGIDWEADTKVQNSAYLQDAGGNKTNSFLVLSYDASVDLSTTPTDLFLTERWDPSGGTNIQYAFPVSSGDYEVRLYLANGWNGSSEPGERVFDVQLEGQAFPGLTGIDLSDQFGHRVGGVIVQQVTVNDGLLDIEFLHGPMENPLVNGIEILQAGGPAPLSVAPVGNQQSTEGGVVSLPVVATGGDTGSFSFVANGLPPGLQIDPATGLISGTVAPGASSSSPYFSSVTVDDDDGDPTDTVTDIFLWTVDVQTPISVAPIDDQQSPEGAVVSLPVLASGGDTGTFGFAATGLPAGLQIEPTTGLIFGTVAAGATAGSPYAVSVIVDDGDGDGADTFTETFAWVVTAQTPISVAPISDQQSTAGDVVSLQVAASGGDTAGSFNFLATGLPSGLQIDPTTGLISGVVAAGASLGSPYSVSITVDDDDGDAADAVTQGFTWTVDAPVGTTPIGVTPIADQQSTEGATVSLQVVATGGDSGSFDFQATGLPGGLQIGAATGLISGTVSAGASASSPYAVSITVDDNDGDATDVVTANFTWVVDAVGATGEAIYRVNAGGVGLPAIDDGIDWEEDTKAQNSQHLVDPGNNKTATHPVLSYDPTVDLGTTPTELFLSERWDGISGTNVVYGFPVAAGDYEVRLYLGNGFNGTSEPGERVFDVLLEGQSFPQLTGIDLSAQFGHRVGGVIAQVVQVTDGLLEIELVHGPVENPILNGIEILPAGEAPPLSVAPVADQQSAEGGVISLPVIASGGDTGSFAFQATGLPPGLSIGAASGLISGTVSAGASTSSPYAVSVTVDDNDADPTDTVTETFTWTVDAPTPISVTPIPDQQSAEGGAVSLQVVATGGDTGSFAFQATGLPPGLSIGAASGLISGTVSAGASTSSPYAVSITVDDNDGDAADTVSETLTWTVDEPVGTPISVTPIADQQSTEGDAVSLQVLATGGDTGSFAFQATGLPPGLSIGAASGLISGTVSAGASTSSPYAVSITVDDNDGDAADTVGESFAWIVDAPVGSMPIVVTPIGDQQSTEGDTVSLQVVASGGDTGSFSFQASGLPSGLQIDGNTGLISGTVALGASAGSPYAASVTVDDGDGDATDTVTESFSWLVSSEPSGSPQLSISDVTVAEGAGTAVFLVSLSEPSGSDVSFNFSTSDGTATTSWRTEDYGATSGSRTIVAGQLTATIEVPIIDDIAIEGDETFDVDLTNVSGAAVADGSAVGTIDEDDGENLPANLITFDLAGTGNPFMPEEFDMRSSFTFTDAGSGIVLVATAREVLVDPATGEETKTVVPVDVTQTVFGLGVAGGSDLAGTNVIFANQIDGKGIDGVNDGTGDYEELVISVTGGPAIKIETITFGNGNSDDDWTLDVGGVELVSLGTATDPRNLPHDVSAFGLQGIEFVFGVLSNTGSDDYAVRSIQVSVE